MNPRNQSSKSRVTSMDVRPVRRPGVQSKPAAAKALPENRPEPKPAPKKKPGFIARVRSHPLRNHPFVIPVTTFVLLFFLSLSAYIFSNGSTIGASDSRLVNLTVDGKRQVIPTRAETVKEFLERLDIELQEKDIVEPSLDAEIIDSNFSVNVYKARTITLIDGEKEVTTISAAPTPRAVAEQAGLNVYPEDKVETKAEVVETEDVLRGSLVAETIVIERAVPIKLSLFGVAYDIRTHADTVADLLKEKSVENVSVFPEPSTPLVPDSAVYITDSSKKITVVEEKIKQTSETVDDFNLERGQTQVRDQGREGRKAVIYEIAEDGVKKPLQEVIIEQPIKKVIARGRKLLNLNVSAQKQEIMRAAGISPEDYSYVDFIVGKESGWNAGARNKYSGAYGLCQALPGSKMATAGADWETNPVTQLKWCNSYANRPQFGGWEGAYIFWITNRWW